MAIEDEFANLTPAQRQAALEGPALRPPFGVLPNFIDPPNENALGYGLLIACASICAVIVAIRLYARIVIFRKMDFEDWLVVAALGVLGGFLYISFEIVNMPGLYVHQWNVQLKRLSDVLYNVNTNYIIYGVLIMLLKAGILLEWTHIFVPHGVHNTFWYTCHITLWINVMFYIACTIVENFSCTPREKIWNKMLMEGHCVNNPALITSSGILNLASDVIIFALPQRIIWTLKISTKKRLGVCLVFATGVFGCVCGALRLVSTTRALGADDITYCVGSIGLWSIGEVTSGFLILCVPSVPKVFRESPFIQKLAGMVKRTTRTSRTEGTVNSRRGLPSWYRAKDSRKQQYTDSSELEECTHITVRTDITSTKSSVMEREGSWDAVRIPVQAPLSPEKDVRSV